MAGNHGNAFNMYLKVLFTLFFLTGITVWTAGIDMGALSMPVAMLIASVKASFVLYYFMHLDNDSNLNRVMFFTGVFFLLVMFAFSFGDIVTRITQSSTL